MVIDTSALIALLEMESEALAGRRTCDSARDAIPRP